MEDASKLSKGYSGIPFMLLIVTYFTLSSVVPVYGPSALACLFGQCNEENESKKLSLVYMPLIMFFGQLIYHLIVGLIIYFYVSSENIEFYIYLISLVFLLTFFISVFFYFLGRNNWWGRLVEWKNRLKESESDEDRYEDLSCKVVAFRDGFSIKRVNDDLYLGECGEFVSPLERRKIYSFTLYSEAQKFLDENKNIFKLIKNY